MPRFDGVEQVFDSHDARERLVGDLDAQFALERANDLQHAQRVDAQLGDRRRLGDGIEVLLRDLRGRRAKDVEELDSSARHFR